MVQQHNDRSRPGGPTLTAEPKPSMEQALSTIVEIQNLILTGQLELAEALPLIAERTASITRADGVAIGIVQADRFAYLHGTGIAQAEGGAEYPCEETLAAECLASGKILQIPDTAKDLYLSPDLCHRLNVGSLIAAPIHHDGKLAGAIELRYVRPAAFQEPELRTSQLMAGLITTALVRAAEVASKRTLAQERAAMLDAIERIKPQLERMAGGAEPAAPAPDNVHPVPAEPEIPHFTEEELRALLPENAAALGATLGTSPTAEQAALATETCRRCGHALSRDEVFCGLCGTQRWLDSPPEGAALAPPTEEQVPFSAIAPATEPHAGPPVVSPEEMPEDLAESSSWPAEETLALPPLLEDLVAQFPPEPAEDSLALLSQPASPPVSEPYAPVAKLEESAAPAIATFLVPAKEMELPPASETPASLPKAAEPWTTARRTKQWLESLASPGVESRGSMLQRLWQTQRANIYLAISAVLLLAVLAGWGSRPTENQPSNRPRPPQLSFLESILVDLGLAVAPPAEAYRGNPDIKVWVDLHTALYYCPDADQYGKTGNGKFTSQRDAQLDQFEPAFRKACN